MSEASSEITKVKAKFVEKADFEKLKEYGVVSMFVESSGSGDSGSIDSTTIEFTDGDGTSLGLPGTARAEIEAIAENLEDEFTTQFGHPFDNSGGNMEVTMTVLPNGVKLEGSTTYRNCEEHTEIDSDVEIESPDSVTPGFWMKPENTSKLETFYQFMEHCANNGIDELVYEYRGGGDSGSLEETPDEEVPEIVETLRDALFDEHVNFDWYNNEGGGVTITFYPKETQDNGMPRVHILGYYYLEEDSEPENNEIFLTFE